MNAMDSELERLRAENLYLQKDRDHWKASHDNQVKLKRILMDRPDLQDRASRMQALLSENTFLRGWLMKFVYCTEKDLEEAIKAALQDSL
jgi:hypothetical protein